jgi:hypothetical protein
VNHPLTAILWDFLTEWHGGLGCAVFHIAKGFQVSNQFFIAARVTIFPQNFRAAVEHSSGIYRVC